MTLAAGCGGDKGATEPLPDDITPSTSRPTSSTTSTTAPTTTTEAVPFDVEVRRAVIELLEVRNDVFQGTDPARIDDYLTPLCTCYSNETAALEGNLADGHRWSGPALEPLGVRLLDDDPVVPRLVAIVRQHPIDVVDSRGTVIDTFPAFERAALAISVQRNDDGDWRIGLFVNNPDFDSSLAEEIVAEGLP
jgi:hypothetical protein